jgi:hypothetical protein
MSKKIASNRRKDEKELESQINILEKRLSEDPTENLYDQLNETKTRLEKIHDQKIQSLIIQSRIQHYEEGEKSTKFFLNQIKQNKRKATIRKLVVGENEITEEKEIMNELKTFYSNLYSEKTTSNTKNWIKELKQSDLIPQLTPEKNENLKKDIKIEQFENIMKKCSKNKSPGNDGLTQEFYEYFWNEICHTFYESYIE